MITKGKLAVALTLAVLTAQFLSADNLSTATVRVSPQSSVRGEAFTLGDISSITSADEAFARGLRDLRLAFSPMPGSCRELGKDQIVSQLFTSGYTLDRVRLVCPPVVRVYRESQTLSQAWLERRLRDYIIAHAPWSAEEMEIGEISNVGGAVIPAGELSVSIYPKGSESYLGPMPFSVSLTVDGREVSRLVMQARIRVFREVAVAVGQIPARQLIDESDVALRRMDISSTRGKSFSETKDVVGMATTTLIRAGQVVTANSLTKPLLVRRGEAIHLIASRPGFVIRTMGIAQSDGRRGQIIQVLNPSSRKKIEAEVTGPQRARVIF